MVKIPRLKREQMLFQGSYPTFELSPKIPSPCVIVCEEATATAEWGQMAVSGNGGQNASPAMCHHPALAGHHTATKQQPTTVPDLTPLTHTFSRDPWPNRFPEILLFS